MKKTILYIVLSGFLLLLFTIAFGCKAQAQTRSQTFSKNGATININMQETKLKSGIRYPIVYTALLVEQDSIACLVRCHMPGPVLRWHIEKLRALSDSASYYFHIIYPNWPTTGCKCTQAGK